MTASTTRAQDFLTFSSEVTGFTQFELLGTGQSDAYLEAVLGVVGEAPVDALLLRWRSICSETRSGPDRDFALRREIFGDAWLGPLARNIIKVWYSATWCQLPTAWREAYGARPNDVTFVVSPGAYPEGLIWKAIDANPPGAKGPGWGTWASPPQIQDV